jgi:hypothetical protein
MIKVETVKDESRDEWRAVVSIGAEDMIKSPEAQRYLVDAIAGKVAERYVAENYGAIVSKIDPQAIANLAIAGAAGRIEKAMRDIANDWKPRA